MSTEPYLPPSLVQAEKFNIHFDTLITLAREDLALFSAAEWTDTAIHDPGITLLEALAYNISDLSYRCLLPLVDVLTPAGVQEGDPLFPVDFGPERMLTISPITAEDYRRGILDLYALDRLNPGRGGHLFSDAAVEKETGDDRYHYFYNETSREFTFGLSYATGEPIPMWLNGSYRVTVKPDLFTTDFTTADQRQGELRKYLDKHRNICELFRVVKGVGDDTTECLDVPLVMNISVSDTLEDANVLYTDILQAALGYLSPAIRRESSIDLQTGEYSGPQAMHGWITELAPTTLTGKAAQTLNVIAVSQLVKVIAQLPNVATVEYMSLDTQSLVLTCAVEPAAQVSFWAATLRDSGTTNIITTMLQQVTLTRRGIKLTGDGDEIYTLLQQRQLAKYSAKLRLYPVGRYRNLSDYYPATDLIPPLYGLQEPLPDLPQQQLHRFLLGFEQHLADGCVGLGQLSTLLDFAMPDQPDMALFGSQWPFTSSPDKPEPPANKVHADYKEKALAADALSQQNQDAAIALTRFMLGYFGVEPTGKAVAFEGTEEYLQVLRGMLRCMPQVGYARPAIQPGGVSSLQRRIAAQLGIGAELFTDDNDVNLADLPFYLIEHPLLLPQHPGSEAIAEHQVESVESAETPEGTVLLFTADMDLTVKLALGQLIDLQIQPAGGGDLEWIKAILVVEVNGKTFTVYPAEHSHLNMRLSEVLQAGKPNVHRLWWQLSDVWLKDMDYSLDSSTTTPTGNTRQYRITTRPDQPWSPILRDNDTIELTRVYSGTASRVTGSYSATVSEVDSVRGTALMTLKEPGDPVFDPQTNRYTWYILPPADEEGQNALLYHDRFSLTLSVVFRRSLIVKQDMLPEQLKEAEEAVRRIVQAELPAHIRARVLWLSDEQFKLLAGTYNSWQSEKTRLGKDSFLLLKLLSIGMLPSMEEGIGIMKIPNINDLDALKDLTAGSPEWQSVVDTRGLLYIPQNS